MSSGAELEISPELAALRRELRRFVMDELEPFAAQVDETGAIPDTLIALMARQGFLGMRLPETYGGSNLSLAEYCLTLEEFCRSHRIFSVIADWTSGLTPIAILHHGTEAQRRRYLPGLTDGSRRCAFGLTEPEAGSDAAAIRTRAREVEGGWALDGRKHYISGGHLADVVMVLAVTDPQRRARGGITAFLVERGTPGFQVTRVDTTIGSDAIKLGELTFENCVVPTDAVLGPVGGGFGIAMDTLNDGRMSVACSCLGTADRLIEMSIAHARGRTTFGGRLASRQSIQWMIADSAAELMAARALCYDTLRRLEAGEPVGPAAGMCKLVASEMVGRVADRAVQIHGGMGVVRGFPVERFYRDVRHYRIGEGSSEVQRMMIARSLLGREGAD
jgi:acyl-CoA dehydrogenase